MKKEIEKLVNTINANMIRLNGANIFQNQYKTVFIGEKCVLMHNGQVDEIGDKQVIYDKLVAFLPLTE
jgi:ABC-type sugar transport system ATPase subunit